MVEGQPLAGGRAGGGVLGGVVATFAIKSGKVMKNNGLFYFTITMVSTKYRRILTLQVLSTSPDAWRALTAFVCVLSPEYQNVQLDSLSCYPSVFSWTQTFLAIT